jgi:hypothetical protein
MRLDLLGVNSSGKMQLWKNSGDASALYTMYVSDCRNLFPPSVPPGYVEVVVSFDMLTGSAERILRYRIACAH